MKMLQFIELIITSFLFSFAVANLVEIWKPDLWFFSALVSFSIWLLAGIRYFTLKNEMFKHKPQQIPGKTKKQKPFGYFSDNYSPSNK